MTGENRISQTTGTKAKKASKQLASCTSASAPLKRLVPVPTPKCIKGSFAKSPSTSSSDLGCGKTGLHGGNVISNRKASTKSSRTSEGTKDALEDANLSAFESSTKSTGTEFEASNELSLKYIEPDETKCVIGVAEPSLLDPELQLKNFDVLHSNLAVNWFSLGDDEFDDFLKTKTDQNPDMTGSEKQISLSSAAKAADSPNSVPDSTNNDLSDEFQGSDCREYSITTSPQDKKFDERKVVEEQLRIKTPDVKECPNRTNNFDKNEDGPALSETSEGTSEANTQQDTKYKKASGNLLGLEGYGIDVLRGWISSKVLLSVLVVLLTIWFSLGDLIEDGLAMDPPPT